MRLIPFLTAFTLFLSPALALADCAPMPDRDDLKDELYADLRLAPDQGAARVVSERLWAIWLTAPDSPAQQMLDEGLGRIQMGDLNGARSALSALIEYCPDYAEGYNQRAYAAFLSRDYPAALADLDLAIEREPRHLGALTGKALTLIGMGDVDAAQVPLRTALRLNRWLSERAYLTGPMEEET